MSLVDKNLSQIFDVEPTEVVVEKQNLPVVETKDNISPEDDFAFARKNIKDLIKKGDNAIDNILQVASASEHPRAFEVAAGLIKTMADLNKDLLDIHKKKNELTGETTSQKTVIDKAVFVGSTSDLVKLIKGKNNGDTSGNS